MSKKIKVISEYGIIHDGGNSEEELFPNCNIDSTSFRQLKCYIQENAEEGNDIEKAFRISSSRGNERITVKNYVGIIETKSGVVIEVLPKIYRAKDNINRQEDIKETKKIFLRMLSKLRNSPFININNAGISDKQNFTILEIFISSYVNEVDKLLSSGMVGDYIRLNQNLPYIKGRIDIQKQIKKNLVNKGRVYCTFKKYKVNNPHNQTIKNTLLKLYKDSRSQSNRTKILKQLTQFIDVDETKDVLPTLDRAKNKNNRMTKKYNKLLSWSSVFLKGSSFTNFSGNSVNHCILFPMERIFEDFVASEIRKYSGTVSVSTQGKSNTKYLVKQGTENKFKLKPDIILEKEIDNIFSIVDTKWKVLESSKSNFGISISDMYQLFAYGKKYSYNLSHPRLLLLYPKTEKFQQCLEQYDYDNLLLNVFPYDLTLRDKKAKQQIEEIIQMSETIKIAS